MANFTLKPEGIHHHLSPFAFVSYAEDFYAAANSHSSPRKFSPVGYYLACHSIELTLKSFLLLKGITRDEIKNLGHNLEKILDKCKYLGLSDLFIFSELQTKEIASVNKWYCRKGFEYFELQNLVNNHDILPELSSVNELAYGLICSLKDPCRDEANKS